MTYDVAVYALNIFPEFLAPEPAMPRVEDEGMLVTEEKASYHGKDDLLWKGILEEVFEDFLRFFFPEVAERVDLDQGFAHLDKELLQLFPPEDEQYDPRRVDKLVKVVNRQGKEGCFLIHVEAQGYSRVFERLHSSWRQKTGQTI